MPIKSDRWIRQMAESHGMIEPFSRSQMDELLALAATGINSLVQVQRSAIGEAEK